MIRLRTPLAIARRELRGGLTGFRIFLACLAIGVGAIAAVGSFSSAVKQGLDDEGAALVGGDITLRLTHQEATPDQLRFLEGLGTLSQSAYLRAMAHVAGGEAFNLVELKAVDRRYPLFGTLDLDPQEAPAAALGRKDGVWGAAADADLLVRLGVKRGVRIHVGEATYEVRAVVKREPDRSTGPRSLLMGPRLFVSADSLGETGLVRPGSLIWWVYRLRLAPDASLAATRRAIVDAWPDAVWVVRDRSEGSRQITRFVERTTLFMTLVGLTALLVGGVGVGNAVGNYLSGKRETIATLKCIGAPSSLIFAIYLSLTLIMAGGGIAVGLVLGAAAPAVAAAALADILPVPARVSLYPLPLLLAAGFGLLVALCFSVWPIARACEVPAGGLFRDIVAPARKWPRPVYVVLTALAAAGLAALAIVTADDRWFALWFVAGAVGALVLFRLAAAAIAWLARTVPRPHGAGLRLALANLHRPGAPTVSVVLSLGLGLTVLVAVALIEGNMRLRISEELPNRAPSLYFLDIQPPQVAAFEATVASYTGAADGLERMPMLRGRISRVDGIPAAEWPHRQHGAGWVLGSDRGLTWMARPPDGANIVAGRWWPADYHGKPLVSFDAHAAAGLGIGVGDTLTVNILGREVTAEITNLRVIEWDTLRPNFVLIFSPGVIEHAPQTHLAAIRLAPAEEAGLEKAVTERFTNITAIRVRDVLETVSDLLGKIAAAVRGSAAVTLIAGALVLAGAVAAGHRRRVYDAVVLKVLGATRRNVLFAFLIEYGILGLATAVIAGGLGTLAAWLVVTEVMNFPWTFLPSVVVLTALGCTLVTLGFGFAGTYRALGQKAAPLLRNP